MKKMLKWFNVLGVCLFLVACSTTTSTRDDKASESTSQAKTNENNNTTQADNTVTIRAIGDILLHDFVYDTALTGTGEYSFDSMFEPVKPYIENADITIANLETIAAGLVAAYVGWYLQFELLEPRPAFVQFVERHSQRPARLRADDIDNALLAKP